MLDNDVSGVCNKRNGEDYLKAFCVGLGQDMGVGLKKR